MLTAGNSWEEVGRFRLRTVVAMFVLASALLAAPHVSEAQRVVADFNGDGIDDLAVGAPSAHNGRGSVSIFFGTRGGFPTTASLTRTGSSDGEAYGSALAAGNFNRSGRFELAVGAPRYIQ